jgi:hypothetical protein
VSNDVMCTVAGRKIRREHVSGIEPNNHVDSCTVHLIGGTTMRVPGSVDAVAVALGWATPPPRPPTPRERLDDSRTWADRQGQ